MSLRAPLKRSRSSFGLDSSGSSRSKRQLVDSLEKLTLNPNVLNPTSISGEIATVGKPVEPILGYDSWDGSKEPKSQRDDLDDRMDVGGPHTVFISSLDSSDDSSEEDDEENQQIYFTPEIDRKIRDLPYSLALRNSQQQQPQLSTLRYAPLLKPVTLKQPPTELVLYKPKEQIISEAITRQANQEDWRHVEREQDGDADMITDNVNNDDEDAMDMD
ncbi:hypothetical protein V1514DRAFT_323382 [Lipomyces japonicus]|uniref:uncharacterized protein n=1 Tax=Lipomyces japonicus TaxID=56871 RepID=UPI0034CE5CEE